MNTPIADTQQRRGRRQLLFLASLFFVPLLLAFWLYYGGSGWRPTGGTNKGDLINPAVPLPAVALVQARRHAHSRGFPAGQMDDRVPGRRRLRRALPQGALPFAPDVGSR